MIDWPWWGWGLLIIGYEIGRGIGRYFGGKVMKYILGRWWK